MRAFLLSHCLDHKARELARGNEDFHALTRGELLNGSPVGFPTHAQVGEASTDREGEKEACGGALLTGQPGAI